MPKLTCCPQCSVEVSRRANICPNCAVVLRNTLPPQTTGGNEVFALVMGVVVGLFGMVLLTKLPGDTGGPLLKTGLGILGLLLPPAIALAWTNRKKLSTESRR
jgi:hypothetical protein